MPPLQPLPLGAVVILAIAAALAPTTAATHTGDHPKQDGWALAHCTGPITAVVIVGDDREACANDQCSNHFVVLIVIVGDRNRVCSGNASSAETSNWPSLA